MRVFVCNVAEDDKPCLPPSMWGNFYEGPADYDMVPPTWLTAERQTEDDKSAYAGQQGSFESDEDADDMLPPQMWP